MAQSFKPSFKKPKNKSYKNPTNKSKDSAKLFSNSNSKTTSSPIKKYASTNHEKKEKPLPLGLLSENQFLKTNEYNKWIQWLTHLHPIWESRYLSNFGENESNLGDTNKEIKSSPDYLKRENKSNSVDSNNKIETDEKRMLLRPVYWMGNWQFACLGYFQLPNGTINRCVSAEPFPDFVQQKVNLIEEMIKDKMPPAFIPKKWKLNTLLINYYGSPIEEGKKVDQARLGEHKDHEPGPVASMSFGAKTMFQFVNSPHRQASSQVVYQQWLEDNSLFAFAGEKFKNKLFHRVQRVDRKSPTELKCQIPNYETRRINLTFRYVPDEYFVDYENLPQHLKKEIDPYINELALHTQFFADLKLKAK